MKRLVNLFIVAALLAPMAAAGQEAPDAEARSRIVIAETALRSQAGTVIRTKAERAARYLSGVASEADLAALDAERSARALGETRDQLAGAQAARYVTYLAGRARLDGVKARALRQLAAGDDPQSVLAALDADVAAVLASVPRED